MSLNLDDQQKAVGKANFEQAAGDLARAGKIRAHIERFGLDRVEDAYTRMREGSLDGRAVICPNG